MVDIEDIILRAEHELSESVQTHPALEREGVEADFVKWGKGMGIGEEGGGGGRGREEEG